MKIGSSQFWNRYESGERSFQNLDFHYLAISKSNIKNLDVSQSNFAAADFSQSYFRNCDFTGCYFVESDMYELQFRNCNFKDAVFSKVASVSSHFEQCIFENTKFKDSSFEESNFETCLFHEPSWSKVTLGGRVINSVLVSSNLEKSNFSRMQIVRCQLPGDLSEWKSRPGLLIESLRKEAFKCSTKTQEDNSFEQSIRDLLTPNDSYRPLAIYLQQKDWLAADEETARIICNLVGIDPDMPEIISNTQLSQIFAKDIRSIDLLWRHFSNNHFGFSHQSNLWYEIIGRNILGEEDFTKYHLFLGKLGWDDEQAERYLEILQTMDSHNDINSIPAGYFPMLQVWPYQYGFGFIRDTGFEFNIEPFACIYQKLKE